MISGHNNSCSLEGMGQEYGEVREIIIVHPVTPGRFLSMSDEIILVLGHKNS